MSDISDAAPAAAPEAETQYPPPVLAWAMVAVLFVAYIFSFIDRMIIGLLVEPLKADLGLSDTQVSLLQGFAFAIFYTVIGLPLGRLIDRTARMRIVAVGVALWTTTLALAAGFLVISTSAFSVNAEMGLLVAVVVVLALVVDFLLLPGLLIRFDRWLCGEKVGDTGQRPANQTA